MATAKLMETAHYWWQICRRAAKLWLECNAFSYAGSLAFYTLFSLAPTVIIAVTVIGFVLGQETAHGEIVAQLEGVMGGEAAAAVEQAVNRSRLDQSGLVPTLLGVGALLIGATTVFAQMQFSLNTIWGVAARPNRNSVLAFLLSRVFSLTVVLAIGFVLLVSLLMGVALRAMLYYADQYIPVSALVAESMESLMSFALVSLLFATIFKVLPDVILGWRDVWVGAVVTALLFTLGRYGISVYLGYTATASAYGAAGSLVLILLWVYYSSLILLLGAAFTRIHLDARGKALVPRNSAVLIERRILE